MLIGGSGEVRTLALVAEHADACNLFGEPDVVRRKIEVLDRHCERVGRERSEIEVTQLSALLSAPDDASLKKRVDALKTAAASPEEYAERAMAGTTDLHIERFSSLAEAGIQTAMVSLADVGHPQAVADFAPVIDALSS